MSPQRVALITGITGQDGSYLAELLLEKGYEVHGLRRRSSSFNTGRIDHLLQPHRLLELHYGDLSDYGSLTKVIAQVQPTEIYHLGAQSHVAVSFETPEYTGNIDALGTLRLLEAVKSLGLENTTRIYQASTSELYGQNIQTPQNENTRFDPVSPYAIAKQYSYGMVELYRNAFGFFASSGILFNHESPRRGETFVTRKISMAVARRVYGSKEVLKIGNLNAIRDWGHAKDYVRGMWQILQHSEPDDFVLATGYGNTVRDFMNLAFSIADLEIIWEGNEAEEKARLKSSGEIVVEVDRGYFRPAEVPVLIGDSTKARTVLGWKPQYSLEELVNEMVINDLNLLQNHSPSQFTMPIDL